MKKTTYVAIACVIIVLVGCAYYFLREEPLLPRVAVQAEVDKGTLSYKGNSIIEEKNGKRLWEVEAETIDIDMATKNISMKNMKGIFYQEAGGQIQILAPVASIDSKTKEIRMTGNIQATSKDGAKFSAQEIRWLGQEEKFYGVGNVSLTKGDAILTGDNIESDVNMGTVKVSGHAKIVKGGIVE